MENENQTDKISTDRLSILSKITTMAQQIESELQEAEQAFKLSTLWEERPLHYEQARQKAKRIKNEIFRLRRAIKTNTPAIESGSMTVLPGSFDRPAIVEINSLIWWHIHFRSLKRKKSSIMRPPPQKKPLAHYLFAGCLKSRWRKKEFEFTTKINEVTCPQCLNIIKRKGLVGRDHFPEMPTFEVKIKYGVAVFICPVCGKENRHGPGSGEPFCDHVVSHCDCWEHGYYIKLRC